jgi:hypothetical protein
LQVVRTVSGIIRGVSHKPKKSSARLKNIDSRCPRRFDEKLLFYDLPALEAHTINFLYITRESCVIEHDLVDFSENNLVLGFILLACGCLLTKLGSKRSYFNPLKKFLCTKKGPQSDTSQESSLCATHC